MPAPTTPFQPYASQHAHLNGPGDGRPTALQVVKDCDAIGKLTEKTVLITGCSAGMGVETARALYAAGATLFLTTRDMTKLDSVIEEIVAKSGGNIGGVPRPIGIEMELGSLDSVKKAAETFKAKSGGKLNILINNAGVMIPPYGKTQDGFDTQLGVCHYAHFLLFELLKPLLLQSAKESGTTSRVINLASAVHRMGGIQWDKMNPSESTYNPVLMYAQAKTANIYMANAITRYDGSQGLTGLSVHPGAVQTNLFKHTPPEVMASFGDPAEVEKLFKNPEQGAATTVWAAVSPHFEDFTNGGRFLGDVGECGLVQEGESFESASYAPHAYDTESEDRLWRISEEAVKAWM